MLPLSAPAPMPTAAREGRPVLLSTREEWLDTYPQVPPRGDFEGFAAVPLLYETDAHGVMGLGYPDARNFDAGDVEMLVAVARQGAQALERARLYEERAYVARTLQAGLLPKELPMIEGSTSPSATARWATAARSAATSTTCSRSTTVVARRRRRHLRQGHRRAVLTGVVRSTVRALALRVSDPSDILAGVNAALLRESSPQALARRRAAWCAETATGSWRPSRRAATAAARAPGLRRRRGGRRDRAPAGFLPTAEPSRVDVHLAAGDLLLLYTDGIIDARPVGASRSARRA
jgi:hypothetical protein